MTIIHGGTERPHATKGAAVTHSFIQKNAGNATPLAWKLFGQIIVRHLCDDGERAAYRAEEMITAHTIS
jgi:hypothetical protein